MQIIVSNPTKIKKGVPMKRKVKRRKRVVAKKARRRRRLPVMLKANPTKRRRRRSIMKVKRKVCRTKRNPSVSKNFDFQNVLISGAIAGAGSFAAIWLSNKVNDLASAYTKNSSVARNAIALAVAMAGSYAGYYFLDKKQADALASGMVGAIVLVLAKNAFGFNLGLSGDVSYLPSGYENIGLLEQSTALGMLESKLAGATTFDYSSYGDDFDSYM